MTATVFLAAHAPEISKADQKARRKAEKKRHNKQLETLGDALNNLREVIYGAQDRVGHAQQALKQVESSAPTQAVSDFLNNIQSLLAQCDALREDMGQPAQEAIAEHFFPGRAAKWAAQDEERNEDRRYAQAERQFGA